MKTITPNSFKFSCLLLVLLFIYFNLAFACEVNDFCRTHYNTDKARCISGVCVCKRGFDQSAPFDANCDTGQPISNSWYTRKEVHWIIGGLVFVVFCSIIYCLIRNWITKRSSSNDQNNQPGRGEHVQLELSNSS